jgi:hypothetical protein
MKNILFIAAVILGLQSCSSSATESSTQESQKNFVVVLDLSDRIIQKQDQINIDTSVISAVFEEFQKSVRINHLVVKSTDKFSIRIIPQKGSKLPLDFFENSMSIDMGKFSAMEKLKKLDEFAKNFPSNLQALYLQAKVGSNSSDYAGVDIWQYFNEQINSDLDQRLENKVYILTDGYFDFEDKNHGIKSQEFSTTTTPLLKKMNGLDWKNKADSLGLGILPVALKTKADWQVCGIQSKAKGGQEELLESQKLCYLWTKWLKSSGAEQVKDPILNSSANKVKSLIQQSI